VIVSSIKKKFLTIAALALISSPVAALPWIEMGDAGETIATAQSTTEPVTSISGSLYSNPNGPGQIDLVDIFRIAVGAPSFLRITTGNGLAPNAIDDPVLYLFDQNGVAIVMNDDDGLNGAQSTITPLNSSYLAGIYYIAIAFAGVEPLGTGGTSLFDIFGSFAVNSTDPLASWTGAPLSTNPDLNGSYTLTLKTVPVPSGLLLLMPCLLGLGALRRNIRATR
jgi:hypothetical protein